MPVAAAVVPDPCVAAAVARLDMAAEGRGPTLLDGGHHAQVRGRQRGVKRHSKLTPWRHRKLTPEETAYVDGSAGSKVCLRTVGSEPDVGVGHAGPGYPRETERPGWAGRCGRRRRSGKDVPSSDNPSAAEGSSGARVAGGVGRHRWLRQASLEAALSRARTTSGWALTLGRARILRSAPQGRGRLARWSAEGRASGSSRSSG